MEQISSTKKEVTLSNQAEIVRIKGSQLTKELQMAEVANINVPMLTWGHDHGMQKHEDDK